MQTLAAPLSLAALVLASVSLSACAVDSNETNDLKNAEKAGGPSQHWIYEGMLPKLESTSIFVSLRSHTARVTGLLPASFKKPLPFYAESEQLANGRTQVTIVYPVATGKIDPSTGQAPAGPGSYPRLFAIPYTQTTDKAAWGGFPFMQYSSRGLAFHGPITSVTDAEMGDQEWRLIRGPVSHGCQRMQGEHVVELAELLGIDMSKPHAQSDKYTLEVKTVVSKDFDTFEGRLVDVDYPALPSVERPTGDVHMFATWDSRDFPRWVCAYDPSRPLDEHHCDLAGEVRRDAITGKLLVPPSDAPWIGTTCGNDGDCGFDAGGIAAKCIHNASGTAGFCSVPCQGYCPDQPGSSATFCANLGGVGQCVAKAGPENDACGDITGTKQTLKKRFVGTSGAKAAQSTVCSF